MKRKNAKERRQKKKKKNRCQIPRLSTEFPRKSQLVDKITTGKLYRIDLVHRHISTAEATGTWMTIPTASRRNWHVKNNFCRRSNRGFNNFYRRSNRHVNNNFYHRSKRLVNNNIYRRSKRLVNNNIYRRSKRLVNNNIYRRSKRLVNSNIYRRSKRIVNNNFYRRSNRHVDNETKCLPPPVAWLLRSEFDLHLPAFRNYFTSICPLELFLLAMKNTCDWPRYWEQEEGSIGAYIFKNNNISFIPSCTSYHVCVCVLLLLLLLLFCCFLLLLLFLYWCAMSDVYCVK